MIKEKIYKAFHTYETYLNSFYEKNQSLKHASFDDQRKALIYDSFPWIFTWSAFNNERDIDIFETVHNCEWLQKSWDTSGKAYENWQIEIVIEQIKSFQPNICVLYPPELFTQEIIEQIKSAVKHEMLIVGYDGMNRMNIELYKGYDLVITCSEYICDFYRNKNQPTYALNFCFDESVLNRISLKNTASYKLGFSGSIYSDVHDYRYELLKYLTQRIDVEVRSEFGSEGDYSLTSKGQLKRLIKRKDLANYLGLWRISKTNKGPVFGLEMYQFLRDSKISINMHGDHINFAANVRLYEITGTGSCMLTDWKSNIAEIFTPDKEIVTYKSQEEACDKAKFLLKNERTRERIARAGQQRTLENYTYEKRMPHLFSFLKRFYNSL
jgi:hypothetical protein